VCVTYFGDGAVNQGQVYESFNMAKLWNLPVLYIVENNKYAMGTSVERSSGEVELYKRGISFGIEGKKIDGMNFESVYHGIKEAVDQIKSGRGPLLIEVETYRYRGHSMSDPAKYRAKEEVEKYKSERDPIDAIEKHLISSKLATKPDLEAIEKRIVDQVKEAVAFAQNSSEPSEEELYKDIYVV